MGTLLTEAIYDALCKARQSLVHDFGPDNISGIHLPWAGNQFLNPRQQVRSLYVVGIATAAGYAIDVEPNFDAAGYYVEHEWREHSTEKADTPFWQFVSGLTQNLYGMRHYDCMERWGWSSLFKIAYNDNAIGPDQWPRGFFDAQKDVCAVALRHEFNQLRNTAIFIGAKDDGNMLSVVLPNAEWDRRYEADGIWFWNDPRTRNSYVWGYHPKAARTAKPPFFDRMLTRTQSLFAK